MSEKDEKIINTTIDASDFDVPIEGLFMKEKRYALTPLEHKILSESKSSFLDWAKRLIFITIGLLLSTLSKLIIFLYEFSTTEVGKRNTLNINIESWELVYLGIGSFVSLILFLLSKSSLDNNERKEVISKIKNYFDAE